MADLQKHFQCLCFQYADDTTLYLHAKVSKLDDCTTGLNDAIARLENYSADSNLALNAKKAKWMLLSTTQMSRVHSLDSCTLNVNCKGDPLECVQSTKVAWTTSWPTSDMERAYHQNNRVMLRDTGSSRRTEAYGSISCEEAAGTVPRYFQAGLRLCSVRSITSLAAATPPESAKRMCGLRVKEIR